MKVATLLESRRANWQELDRYCWTLEQGKSSIKAAGILRFAALYRRSCADLALAEAYQLPPDTVQYLHHLVARAHNQLYRSRAFHLATWWHELIYGVPRRLYHDGCLRLAFVLFWGMFLISAFLAYTSTEYCDTVLGKETMAKFQEMYSQPLSSQDASQRASMVGFYVFNNTGIGLRCFAFGLLGGIGGLLMTGSNAMIIGATFGYMATIPERANFFQFVTAHGPFELTAIVVSAAAGMRLGFSLIATGGLTRRASLTRAARESMPTVALAMILFFLAALIEGFLSPSPAPYWVKAATSALSSGLILFYFVMLGQPPEEEIETG